VAIPRRRERSAPNAPQASLPPAQPAKTTLFAGVKDPGSARPVPRRLNIYPLLLFHVAFLKQRWAESAPDTGVLNGRGRALKSPAFFFFDWRKPPAAVFAD
jgi:hypothetical protein